ncbi:MAG: NAD(P)H-quinone oxidoreductase [Actinomycetales bacterium]
MRAVTIPVPGGPDALVLAEVPDPEPAPDEVVVDVVAAGVNKADTAQREGRYDPPPGTSPYPGMECSGRISALGRDVETWSVGDEVCALVTGGAYAERVAVPTGQLMPVPPGIGLVEAAALPEVTCTVWANVFMAAGLQRGEVLLVHGGSSGVGTMAVQLARELGARVAVTAGSTAKLEACRALGADILVNYKEQDFVEAVQAETDGAGADVVLDNMGAEYLARNVAVLARNGRLVVIGFQGGTKAEIDLWAMARKRVAVIAALLRSRPPQEKAVIVRSTIEHVWPLLESGAVHPVIHATYPMVDAADAHRVMEASTHVGKLLLVT